MGRSEDKTDIWGDKYTDNYDDDGNKVGESREKTDIWGDPYTEHSDTSGYKTGESVEKTDIWGDPYTEHSDTSGYKTGESVENTDIWGDPYTEHSDTSGYKTGESVEKTDIWGDSYTEHTGHGSRGTSKTAKAINKNKDSHKFRSGSSYSTQNLRHDNSASSGRRWSVSSTLSGIASVAIGVGTVLAVLFVGQILMVLGSYLTGLPHAADHFFYSILLLPVGLMGILVWLAGFLMSLPLFLIEHITGLCLAFAPGTVLSSSIQVGTISFCK